MQKKQIYGIVDALVASIVAKHGGSETEARALVGAQIRSRSAEIEKAVASFLPGASPAPAPAGEPSKSEEVSATTA